MLPTTLPITSSLGSASELFSDDLYTAETNVTYSAQSPMLSLSYLSCPPLQHDPTSVLNPTATAFQPQQGPVTRTGTVFTTTRHNKRKPPNHLPSTLAEVTAECLTNELN